MGCGSDESPGTEATGGTAGASGSGGSKSGSGGAPSSGGGSSASGGTSASGGGTSTGNATSSDGGPITEDPDSGAGGSQATGGAPAASGGASPATGGAPPATGGAPPAPKCGTDYNDNPACNTCMTTKCCNELKACTPGSPCEKFLECAVAKCPNFNSGCLQFNCSSVASGAQAAADLIECRQTCTDACPLE